MKTLLFSSLAFAGLLLSTLPAQARDHRHGDRDRDSTFYYRGYSHDRGDRDDCEPHDYYSHRYYRPRVSYSSGRCEPRYSYSERGSRERRRSFHRPLFSFLFGF